MKTLSKIVVAVIFAAGSMVYAQEAEPAPAPAPAPEVKTEPAPAPAPASEVKTEPAPAPAPASEVKTEPAPAPAPASEVKTEPAPAPVPETTPAPKRRTMRGMLPKHYREIISNLQRKKIYAIQDEYKPQFDELDRQRDALRAEMEQKMESVLTEDQKAELKRLRAADK